MRSIFALRLLLLAVATAILVACASIGRPEGGPRDENPPVFVRSNPMPGQLNVSTQKLVFEFDENVQLEDPMSKVIVSPAQYTTPLISANGRRVTVELRDTLKPNTTYTVDFADAIKDLNESNVLDGLAIDFATGDVIDSLRISGMVFDARTLEPAQGMIVGVYSNLSDTAIRTLPFERITKTNQLGQFTIRGLKPGDYRIYAVNDLNRDYHWDRSEDVAFYDVTISPSTTSVERRDTLTASDGTDSIVMRQVTRYLPDDILLTWFNLGYMPQYLKTYQRQEPRTLEFEFGAKADSLPVIKLLNTPRAGEDISRWAVIEATQHLDTLKYWITDTSLIALDTLQLAVGFMRPDSAEVMRLSTDTLTIALKNAKRVRAELQKREEEARAKAEKDSVPLLPEKLVFKITSTSSQDLNKALSFVSETPIAKIDSTLIRFETLVDSTWQPLTAPPLEKARTYTDRDFRMSPSWEADTKYRLRFLPGALTDIYDHLNDTITHELTTKKLDDYSSLAFRVSGLDGRPAILEVLNSSDKVVTTTPVRDGIGLAEYLSPGTYYARLFIDSDSNGVFTPGILDSIQPEEVYYYPKKINLKKNWGVEQTWDIYELPIDLQKPNDIKKNKPKRRRNDAYQSSDSDEDEDDDFFDDPFMNAASRSRTGSGRGFKTSDPRQGF